MGLFGAHDVFEYLDNGGVIMVNDSSVSLDDFKEWQIMILVAFLF